MTLDFLQEFDFFTGVPDSLLQPLCAYLYDRYGTGKQHIVAANEGNAAALAAGYHLSTGKTPVVYLQNSGEGNIVNPLCSLLHTDVYAIPCLFIIGWRGEPGTHDEPQHLFQGKVTLKLLEDLSVEAFVVDKTTRADALQAQMQHFQALFAQGKQAALVIKKGALTYEGHLHFQNAYPLKREEAICRIAAAAREDVLVCTTGKASRELFEYRAHTKDTHARDFLTVGSMGHASSIALGIALQKSDRRVWCIDGDGALLMHMGALSVIGSQQPDNLIHVVINNQCHETVGGMPTAVRSTDLPALARACGYPLALRAENEAELRGALDKALQAHCLCLIEVCCGAGARADLGRPTTTAQENKRSFMDFLRNER